MTKHQLLVVDDDPGIAGLVSTVGEMCGFETFVTNSAKEFKKTWVQCTPSVIVMDLVMPDTDGIELLLWLAELKCTAPIILMSGYNVDTLRMAAQLGTDRGGVIIGSLVKPFKIEELEAMLNDIMANICEDKI